MAAEKGNKYNQEWTLENATPRFEDALAFAESDKDCLCMQDAVAKTGIPTTTFYYLIDNHKELKSIKEDINSEIIRRINKKALENKFGASPAIWRMKQLGEKDKQEMQVDVKDNLSKYTTEELIIRAEAIQKLNG